MIDAPTDEELSTPFPQEHVDALVRLTGSYIVTHSLLENRVRVLSRLLQQRYGGEPKGQRPEELLAFVQAALTANVEHVPNLRELLNALAVWKGCCDTRNQLAHRVPVAIRNGKKTPQLVTSGHDKHGKMEIKSIQVRTACNDVWRMNEARRPLDALLQKLLAD